MQISIICFSLTGYTTAEQLQKGLLQCGFTTNLFKKSKYLEDSIAENTAVWTGHHFKTDDGLIFVGACGIAVRSIAPYVVSKKSDPAVLVVDECGKFVISLLSGHLGGANALALKTAEILGAEPVVTTATDLHDRFAVDVFAKNNHCAIFNMKAAKEVSAAILAGESVGFYSEFPYILADRFNGTALLKRYFFKFIVVTERPVSDCRNRRGDGDLLNARLFKYIRTDRL